MDIDILYILIWIYRTELINCYLSKKFYTGKSLSLEELSFQGEYHYPQPYSKPGQPADTVYIIYSTQMKSVLQSTVKHK